MSSGAPYQSHTGAVYFRRITSQEVNRRIRARFQDLVLRLVPPGAMLLDFGAGPGIDARFFAERGFAVEAYDTDPQMREFFATHCREFIASGKVTLDCSSYRQFLARNALIAGRPADLVISNFAPLNQVDDLPELFAKFHAITRPDGKLLLSVLTPYYLGEMKTGRWWRNAPRLWRSGHVFVPGGGAPPHTRRRLADLSASSAPYFTLARAFCALPAGRPRDARGIDLKHGGRGAWLHLAKSRFMILLFEKQ